MPCSWSAVLITLPSPCAHDEVHGVSYRIDAALLYWPQLLPERGFSGVSNLNQAAGNVTAGPSFDDIGFLVSEVLKETLLD